MTRECVPTIQQRLSEERISVLELAADPGSAHDTLQTCTHAKKLNAEWILIDGFCFTSEYVGQVQSEGAPVALIDDHAMRGRYPAELIINPNIFASAEMYSPDLEGRILAGPQFSLIRREFRLHRRPQTSRTCNGRHLLVTLGGGDRENVTCRVMQAINELPPSELRLTVLCGAANPNYDLLRTAQETAKHPTQLLIDVRKMPELLDSVDLAVCAPGVSAAEFAALRIPMLLITIADNHVRTAEEFAQRNFAAAVGWWNRLTVSELAAKINLVMTDFAGLEHRAKLAAEHVDLFGSERVVKRMLARKTAVA